MGSSVFSKAVFIFCTLSVTGNTTSSEISRTNLSPKSTAPRKPSEKIPIMSAVIPFASLPENTSKISARAADKSPANACISDVTSNNEIIRLLIQFLFFDRYLSIPPIRLSAIVNPIRAAEPVIFPKARTKESAHLSAAFAT